MTCRMKTALALGIALLLGASVIAGEAEGGCNLLANGSFEFWSHYGTERLPEMLANGPAFEGEDPLIPTRWLWRMGKPGSLKRCAGARTGQYALAVVSPANGGGTLSIGKLEAVPNADYAFGVWAKGMGDVTVQVVGEAPEGEQEVGKAAGKAGKDWTRIGGAMTIPGHIRMLWLRIHLGASVDLALDDAFIAAPLDKPWQADEVLSKKAVADADTVLFLDFERDDPAIKFDGKARYTAPEGGRFGRGLRMDGAKMQGALVFAPFRLPAMPEEGTLEFWLSPDEMPNQNPKTWDVQSCFLQVRGAANELFSVHAVCDCTISCSWRIDGDTYGKTNGVSTYSEMTARRLRKGEWHHVAVSWDRSVWRMYFDGVLANATTKPPLTWWDAPVAVSFGSEHKHVCWNGVIDEVRISKVKRYGPFTPKGAKPNPLPVPEDLPAEAKTREPAKPKADFREERKKLLGAIPASQPGAFESAANADGDYVYEAASARPLVDGIDVKRTQDADGVKGVATAVSERQTLLGSPSNVGMYWRLKGIAAGRYWVGLLHRSGAKRWDIETDQDGQGQFDLFLNGRILHCSTLSDPVQAAPGAWFAEAQAAEAQELKEGDEIAVVSDLGRRAEAVRLLLHPTEPVRGALRMRINPGPNTFNHNTSLGINADATFVAAQGRPMYPALFDMCYRPEQWAESPDDLLRAPDGRAVARCALANPLPVPVEVDYECMVSGYYLKEAGRDAAHLTLAPHAYLVRDVPFTLIPGEPAYSVHATLKVANRPDLKWPVGDEFAFFPGLRQLLPWRDPFAYADHRRVIFKNTGPGDRPCLALFGDWELALTRETDPPMPAPAELKFDRRHVPPWWGGFDKSKEPKAQALYLRRKFILPEAAERRVQRLIVEHVDNEATAYVNGQKVGQVRGSATPLIADASAALRPGENELVLVVRNRLACMNAQYVNAENPTESCQYLDAPVNCNQDLGMRENIWLESLPEVSAREIKVETSVRAKTIGARFSVVNAGKEEARLRVKVSVEDAKGPVFQLAEQPLTLKPGAAAPVQLQEAWPDPRLWSWMEPNLYVLAVELSDAATGKRLDLARERFGFRETWMAGDRLYFNNVSVRMKGTVNGPPFSVPADIPLGRGTPCPDFTDEIGSLATQCVTAIANTPSKFNVENEAYWQSAQANALARLQREWNHPSIIAWDLSNEWHHYATYTGANMELCSKRFKALADAVEKADPTRWTFFNGDDDIGGLHYNLAAHYMLESARPHPVSGFGFDGHSVYFPDGAFLRPLDRDFKPGEEILIDAPQGRKFKLGSKVLMDTENVWKVGHYNPPGMSKFLGEEDVTASAVHEHAGPGIWMWKQNIDGHRDLGMPMHTFCDAPSGVVTRAIALQQFILPDHVHHGFSGRTLVRDCALLNDLFRPAKLKLTWQLVGPDGQATQQGSEERQADPGTTHRLKISFALPQVAQRTRCTLQLRLHSEDAFAYGEDRDIDVWPEAPAPIGALERRIALFDPRGATAKALAALGLKFETAATLEPPVEGGADVLVIGEGALDEANARQVSGLGKFVEDGGRAVILAQTVAPQGLPVKAGLEPREWVSQPFARLPIHPVLEGLSSWDLHFWAPDRVCARGAYAKPAGGAVIPLVDSGTGTGLEWVQMMEMYRGKGLYLLCQLTLVANRAEAPLAGELLARIVRYAGGKEAFRAPLRRLRAVAERNGPIERRLQDAGVSYELASPDAPLDAKAPTLVAAGIVPSAKQLAAWKAGLADGATLVVHEARPEDAAWLSELAGKAVRITVPRYRLWEGRGYRVGFDALTAGLSHIDLYWKRLDGSHVGNARSQIECPEYVFEQLQDASASIDGGRELVFPGALAEAAVGKGRLILDQRRWAVADERLKVQAGRNLSALALGLDVAVFPVLPPRELPAQVAFRPLDLSPFATRAFADDVAEDGKGGWSDQGPDADLRSFPTGDQSFRGVPFKIGSGEKAIVVLASDGRPGKENLPGEVTIPVGVPVEGLCFLHSAAFSGGTVGQYQIQYADGTASEIALVAGENIRDWADKNGGAFLNERGTASLVAWTGSCKMFTPIMVYWMRWVNPRPEEPVAAVRFANPDRQAVAILIGLTAIVGKDAKADAADLAKAQELLKQAQQAIAADKAADAKTLLKQALALAPSLTAAHQALADLCEKGGNEEEMLEAYHQWTASGARTPLPFNRLGQILEKRKDYKGALDAYAQSLKIEWNQPPTLDAKSRVEKLVAQPK